MASSLSCKRRRLPACPPAPDGHCGRFVQPHRHAARVGVLQHALEREETDAGDDRGLDLAVPLPAIHAAIRIEDLAE